MEAAGEEKDTFSLIPRKNVTSNPPFTIGGIVVVKFAGTVEKERAKVVSKGKLANGHAF